MTNIPILLLVFGSAGAILMNSDFLAPYLAVGGGTLALSLIPLVGFAIAVGFGLHGRDVDRRQFLVCLVTVGLMVGLTFSRQLATRGEPARPLGIHDGAVHTEEAAKVLLRGQNPYAADYRGTPYAALNPPISGGPAINVVWSHYIYPPLTVLLQAAWQALGDGLGFRADVRWLYLTALMLVAGLIVWSGRSWIERSQWLLLTLGNPLVWLYVVVGYNDVLPALGVVTAAWAITRRRWWLAGVAFGLALAAKQSVWVALPLWLMWLWQLRRSGHMAGARMAAFGTLLGAGLAILPFLVWNAPTLYDDIVRYASGAIPYSYPISGSTLLQYLRVWGWVDSPWAVVPAYMFQALIGIPVIWLTARWFWRQPTASRWLAGASATILTVLLFSRYFNSNYLALVVLLGVASAAWQPAKSS